MALPTDAIARLLASLDLLIGKLAKPTPDPFASLRTELGLVENDPNEYTDDTQQQLFDLAMELLYPQFSEMIDTLRNQHPTWSETVLQDTLRPKMNKELDDVFSSLVQSAFAIDGLVDRYIATLYQQATQYQPHNVSKDHYESRLLWWWSIQVTTAAKHWDTLDNAAKEVVLSGLTDVLNWSCGRDVLKILGAQARDREQSFDRVKHDALIAGASLVLARWNEEQKHRFSQKWVTDENGKLAAIAPSDLPWLDAWTWFSDEARKAATATVLNKPYPASGARDVFQHKNATHISRNEEWDSSGHTGSHLEDDPLPALIDQFDAQEQLHTLLAIATPREREMLHLMREGYDSNSLIKVMKISLATLRVNRKNLRDKAITLQRVAE